MVNTQTRPNDTKFDPFDPEGVRLYRVRIDAGGYDQEGNYWGIGQPLYCAEDHAGSRFYMRGGDRRFAATRIEASIGASVWWKYTPFPGGRRRDPAKKTDRPASMMDALKGLRNVGESIYLETTLEGYRGKMNTVTATKTKKPQSLQGRDYSTRLYTAVGSKAGDVLYLIRVTRIK